MPKPFNLSVGTKKKEEEPGTYVSMAQQIELFEKRTPARFRMHSRRTQERGVKDVHFHSHLLIFIDMGCLTKMVSVMSFIHL